MYQFSGLSETGPVREDNQDAICVPVDGAPPALGPLFGIADGMGGYEQGGLASSLALKAFADTYYNRPNGSVPGTLKRGVEAANLAVLNQARQMGVTRMGTTLTAGAIEGSRLHLAHIGDSRAYLLRGGEVTCLTQDHTVVGDLLRMKVINDDQVRAHARRSVLTRAIGMAMFVNPDVKTYPLQPGDRLVICTDGVWAAVEDGEIRDVARAAVDPAALCRALLDRAVENGSDDNVSVVAAHIHHLPGAETRSGKTLPAWVSRLARGRKAGAP